MFTDTFPPAIYPALLIFSGCIFTHPHFYQTPGFYAIWAAVPELILGVIYLIDFIHPFATIDRVNLIRNTIMLIFATELFYQFYIMPKLRRMADGTK